MNTLNELARESRLHRTRDGRLNLDMFSRTLRPRWTLIKIDGAYYDRRGLARWLKERGSFVPSTRRRMINAEARNAANEKPYRIHGKAPVYPAN